ncbi:hypothetical protein X874_8990 [Mannheimia varigena USDA-ARS-USMARC-1312]|uniref:Uncharacterized protein n=1 Tax=Mannheimia varigena USDA-ARS-USMARC-1296 TaxID=1433287 RepID=W0QB16_9PAST|nr:hypothetical protein X808_9640 [Mannheimia varigena USDA-ARS-USMARC-1296]AHG77535.1 hypothetical protein X874_8990 [Mannheimia varigena USDA-ARS-USMARC-1312]AHG79795.1 hypothetical protein X875_11770 [Mannheimia varigena USDA-ARS-USMARC-1388]
MRADYTDKRVGCKLSKQTFSLFANKINKRLDFSYILQKMRKSNRL